jgi:hypothetical protein
MDKLAMTTFGVLQNPPFFGQFLQQIANLHFRVRHASTQIETVNVSIARAADRNG